MSGNNTNQGWNKASSDRFFPEQSGKPSSAASGAQKSSAASQYNPHFTNPNDVSAAGIKDFLQEFNQTRSKAPFSSVHPYSHGNRGGSGTDVPHTGQGAKSIYDFAHSAHDEEFNSGNIEVSSTEADYGGEERVKGKRNFNEGESSGNKRDEGESSGKRGKHNRG